MGQIRIVVPGDVNLDYKIDNKDIIDKIVQIIKKSGSREKKKKNDSEIVGIWHDRFSETTSSAAIQKQGERKIGKDINRQLYIYRYLQGKLGVIYFPFQYQWRNKCNHL